MSPLSILAISLGFAVVPIAATFHPANPGDPPAAQDKVNRYIGAKACKNCHSGAEKSRHATIPSVNVCMNCHSTVGLNREWVLRMKEYWDRGEPIPWVKVHDLPDFVYFDHSAHLNAKNTSGGFKLPRVDAQGKAMPPCQTCHGNVAQMDIVSVQQNFNMQWCIDCHRQPEMKASTDCIACHR